VGGRDARLGNDLAQSRRRPVDRFDTSPCTLSIGSTFIEANLPFATEKATAELASYFGFTLVFTSNKPPCTFL
jgi:hypothetical protein